MPSTDSTATTSLPHPDPCTSYWQQPPDEIADLRTAPELPQYAEVVIVGSGITGASIAYNLLSAKPGLNIVLLEARQAASGASGRNGGHTKTASYRSFLDNIKAVGEEEAIKVSKLEYDCMAAVHDLVKQKGIPCDANRCDTVDIYYDQGHLDQARESVALMEKLIPHHPTSKHTFYSPEETKKNFFAENSLGSLRYQAGSLSAYKLTIGILKLALQLRLNLQTNTPATSISKSTLSPDETIWTVTTPRGNITTPILILATNGYTAHLLPQLQQVIVPFRGVVTAQRPGQSLPHGGDLPTTYSFIYKEGYEYMITRPSIRGPSDHTAPQHPSPTPPQDSTYDIVIGGGLTKTPSHGTSEFHTTDDSHPSIPASITSYLATSTRTFFGPSWDPPHPLGTTRTVWSGIMGYSADGHPLIGAYPGARGLFLAASFQGHGMVLCWLCARALSSMVLGREEEERLADWFPRCFRVSAERLGKRFDGRVVGREVGEAESVNGFDGGGV